jgi:integrase
VLDDAGDIVLESPTGDFIERRAEAIEAKHGERAAAHFADIALGRKTPLRAQLVQMFEREKFGVGYQQDITRAVARLEAWCHRTGVSPVVESINVEVASRYVHEQFIVQSVHYKTTNKDIAALSSYWKTLKKRLGRVEPNPWTGQGVNAPAARHGVRNDKKRPFTDEEVVRLLTGLALKRDWDFSIIAALSGMRENEIAALTVADCREGTFNVTRAKTAAGVRRVPIHPDLHKIVAARSHGKDGAFFLFDELPEQPRGSKRERGAAVAQSFTRERRRLGVEDRVDGQRQANIDFHSWRRWFAASARRALQLGATGFDPWAIAEVMGHKAESADVGGAALPLEMTMGRYAGLARFDALRACVEAVQLPPDAPRQRNDLVGHRKGGRRPKIAHRCPTRKPATRED